jgi:hypothetical protein
MAEVKVGEFVAHDEDGTAETVFVFRKKIDTSNMRTGPGTSLSRLATLKTSDGLLVNPTGEFTYKIVGTDRILRSRGDPGVERMNQEQP